MCIYVAGSRQVRTRLGRVQRHYHSYHSAYMSVNALVSLICRFISYYIYLLCGRVYRRLRCRIALRQSVGLFVHTCKTVIQERKDKDVESTEL